MAMLTRCAACGTTFRITTSQLVSRQGKVRCGSCGEVFSALHHLVHSRGGADPAAMLNDPVAQHESDASIASITPVLSTASVVLNAPVTAPADSPHEAETGTAGASVQEAALEPRSDVDTTARAISSSRARGGNSGSFAWWSLAGAILALTALGAQTAYFYRNETAARLPESKPWLELMCRQAGCKIEAPRDAQAISIESSDLQADPANRNLLTLVALLRNRAGFAQDAPHLELTLTDAQDGLAARRILAPRDYFAATQFAAGSEMQMRIVIDASQLKASGYRLYAFYP